MKDHITLDEYKTRLHELVATWEIHSGDRHAREKTPFWITGCHPYTGQHAKHNEGYESRPYDVMDFPNISEYEPVEQYLPEFVLAACKFYAAHLLKLRSSYVEHFAETPPQERLREPSL